MEEAGISVPINQFAREADSDDQQAGYEFVTVDAEMGAFKNINEKSLTDAEYLFKWGLRDNTEFARFRFNRSFNAFVLDEFLRNFFSSATVRAHLPFLSALPRVVEKVEYQKLSTTAINMEFFDVLINDEIT